MVEPASDVGSADTASRGVPESPYAWTRLAAALQTVLIIAGVSCCVAMSMPQVHIVAYLSLIHI